MYLVPVCNFLKDYSVVIKTFNCKESKMIWEGKVSRKLPRDIQDRALRKLRQVDAAINLDDLKNPPSNHLEELKGNRKNQVSIRINDQLRICFLWRDGESYDVQIVDYHK